MDDIVYYNELYDLYGELLTEKQRQYFEEYYFDNMSFSEMAEDHDMSRNAAFKQIHIVIDKLLEYESILHLKNKRDQILKLLEDVPKDVKERIEDVL